MRHSSAKLLCAIALVLVLPATSAVAGELEEDLGLCLSQPSWLTRVQCYDRTVKAHGIEPRRPPSLQDEIPDAAGAIGATPETTSAASDTASNGKWRVETSPGSEAGSMNVWLMLTSDNTADNPAGEPVAADMALRCLDRSLDVLVWAGGAHFNSPQSITSRISLAEPETLDWGISSDFEWAFHPFPRNFIDAIVGADHLVLSIAPSDAPPAAFGFDLAGLPEIIGQLEMACPQS